MYHILLRLLPKAKSRHITIPRSSWDWLISHFPNFPCTPSLLHDFSMSVPILQLSRLLIQYEILHTSPTPPPPRSQFTRAPTHTWSKCRVAAPKISRHTGAIRSSDGSICRTTEELDAALRPTRAFWQEFPCPHDPQWMPLLSTYSRGSTSFPPCPPPQSSDLHQAIITSPDCSGADGIPYAAWRVCSCVSTIVLSSHFQDILERRVSPPIQTLVFIPKADQGDYADNYRPLGLPNTSDRIVDRGCPPPASATALLALSIQPKPFSIFFASPKPTTLRYNSFSMILLRLTGFSCQILLRLSNEWILIGLSTS